MKTMEKELTLFIKKNGTDLDKIKNFMVESTAFDGINNGHVYENLLSACFELLDKRVLKNMFLTLTKEYTWWSCGAEKNQKLDIKLISGIMASYLHAQVLAKDLE